MPELIVSKNNQLSLRATLTGNCFQIGRLTSSDLVLPEEEISRQHATIELQNGKYILKDSSRLGTHINGSRITEITLENGMQFQIGSWNFTFVAEADADRAFSEDIKTAITQIKSLSQKTNEPEPLATDHFCGMLGKSKAMQALYGILGRVSPTSHTVLIQGPTGAGKELVARAIHQLSNRREKPYLILNCGAISENLIESELFGHERGAFTGAQSRHLGAFESANGGTLFLDEIGELPLELQPKLLRVLENQTIRRVGSPHEVPVDVRVIAATHRNLAQQVREGKFREDLYFRLNVIPVNLPALRERAEDIPMLAESFLKEASADSPRQFSPEALALLSSHDWPGNVRELKNTIYRSLILSELKTLTPECIAFLQEQNPPNKSSGAQNLANLEKETIEETLRKTGGNKTKAAELLGIAKSTLFEKIKKYEITL